MQVLKRICWYVVLASSSSEQITLLETTAGDKRLRELPLYKELLQTFTTKEVQCLKQCPDLPSGSSPCGAAHFPDSIKFLGLLTQRADA